MSYRIEDWGRVAYTESTDRQRALVDSVLKGGPETLVLVEHDPVLTLGAGFHAENLLLPAEAYARRGIALAPTGRGGDVTYHGPGQLVIYPIFDVGQRGRDLHRWLRDLEETMMLVAGSFGLQARLFPPHTGVWVGDRKLAAIGIQVRRWVSMHGIALNCENPLDPFELIVPCGIQGYGVTSLTEARGEPTPIAAAKPAVIDAFRTVFS
jgi:lipoate-protein ligase B